jgi:hypothetical protein
MEQAIQPILKASDWVMITTAIFLGFCALFVPYLAEMIKRKLFAPNLIIKFSLTHPYCHLTKRGDGSHVYYFRFQVINEGKSQARFCEALLEELWIADVSGNFIKDENFSSVNLTWVGHYERMFIEGQIVNIPAQFININPNRRIFCDIGHISHPDFQKKYEKSKYYLGSETDRIKFFFDSPVTYFSQRDCIPHGQAKIKVTIYCENAPKVERYFQIVWSGNWKDREEDMFREIVIS